MTTSIATPAIDARPRNSRLLRVALSFSSFPALISAALAAGVLWKLRDYIADPDLWWHLRNAQYFVAHRHFPNFDTYSYTAAGSPWINHEWLSELFYYAGFRAFGLQGVFLVVALVMSAIMVAVFWLAMRESGDPLAALISTLLGGLFAIVGFGPRTQHFGWLCFVVMLAVLLRFRSTRRGPLWAVPLVFCVWINCHGSWLIGLAVYAMFLGAGLVRSDIGRLEAHAWSKPELRKLLVAGAGSVAALFVNPFGPRLVWYPFNMMLNVRLAVANVQEWTSVNFSDGRGKIVAFVLGLILFLALAGRRRWRIDDALLVACVLYAGLVHIRFLLLTGIVLPWVLAPHLGKLSDYDARQERRVVNGVLLALLLCSVVFLFPSAARLQASVSDHFPAGAVDFLRTHPQQGRMFNHYGWGGYLEWYLPEAKVFVDGRADIFEYNGSLKDFFDADVLRNSQEILDRHQVTYVLYPADAALTYHLSKVPQWQRVYGDDKAVIYRRAGMIDTVPAQLR